MDECIFSVIYSYTSYLVDQANTYITPFSTAASTVKASDPGSGRQETRYHKNHVRF